MIRPWTGITTALVGLLACAPSQAPEAATADMSAPAATAAPVAAAARCVPSERMPVEGRASPYDSTTLQLDDAAALVCYGRPSMRGRTVFGGLVPYDKLWRTGANEPTILHLPVAARIAGIEVEPGSYSLYTIPGREQWTVVVNRSTSQWGYESQYTEQVQAQEVGRATVPAERTEAPVETFTIRAAPGDARGGELVLEWENTRVRIPVMRR